MQSLIISCDHADFGSIRSLSGVFRFFLSFFSRKKSKMKKTTTTTKQAKKKKKKMKKKCLIERNQERKLIYKQNCKGSTSEQVSKISTITTPTIPLLESLKSGPYGPQDLGLTQRHLETFKTKLSVYWKEKHFNVCWTPSANFNCSEQCVRLVWPHDVVVILSQLRAIKGESIWMSKSSISLMFQIHPIVYENSIDELNHWIRL